MAAGRGELGHGLATEIGTLMMPDTIGRYQVRSEVGAGGFAAVFRAWDPALEREVAIKVLHPHMARDPAIRERFVREGRALARVHHPNVVQVYDTGEADGRVYLAMEYVPGRSLADLYRDRPAPLQEVVQIVSQVGAGLDAIHAAGLVHRDVKPPNILATATGRAVLLDLGIALSLDRTALTGSGAIIGTPGFLAPEQVQGSSTADLRTDVYQLGATAFSLLSAQVPFEGDTAQVLFAIISRPPRDLGALRPDLPPFAVGAVNRALAKDPAQRPVRAGAFAAMLAGSAQPEETAPPTATFAPASGGAVSPPTGPPQPPADARPAGGGGSRGGGNNRLRIASVAAVVLLLALGGGLLYALFGGAREAQAAVVIYEPPLAVGADPFTQPVDVPITLAATAVPSASPTVPPTTAATSAATTTTTATATATATAVATETPVPPAAPPAPQIGAGQPQPGSGAGTFGGTGINTVCDRELLIRELSAARDRLVAWASVEGIAPENVASFIRALRPATLTKDTRITNHAFTGGRAVPFQSILAAGTAVLVDDAGNIVARCRCGNPLSDAVRIGSAVCRGCASGYEPPQPLAAGIVPAVIIVINPPPVVVVAPAAVQPLAGPSPAGVTPGTNPAAIFASPSAAVAAGALAPLTPSAQPTPAAAPSATRPPSPSATPTRAPTATPVPSPTPKPEPVNVSSRAKVAASTTSPGFGASLGVDGDPTTSWFSTGPGRDGTSTYTFTFADPVTVTGIEFVGNERNRNPAFRTGYGFRAWSIELKDADDNVLYTVQSSGSGTASQNHDVPAVEGVVLARFIGRQHESIDCGGFAELRVFGY